MKYKIITLLVILLSLNFVSAWSNNTFNNTLTAENLSFSTYQNLTRYLEIPQNITITEAYINLTGFRGDWRTTDYTDTPVCEGSCLDAVANAFDKSLTTLLRPNADGSDLVTNYSVPYGASLNGTTKAKILLYYYCATNQAHRFNIFWKSASFDGGNWQNSLTINQDCSTNYKGNGIALLDVDADITGNMTVRVDQDFVTSGTRMGIRELRVLFYNSTNNTWGDYLGTYPSNDGSSRNRILINGTTAWSNDDIINITNRTNFAKYINTYCNGLSCNVPFLFDNFHEYDFGELQYSNMLFSNNRFLENSITYNETTASGAIEKFILNLTYDSTYYSGITVLLTYNNTNYSTSNSGSGDNLIYTGQVTIPVINSQIDKEFYFIVGLTNSSGTFYYHSNTNNQTIGTFFIDDCSSYTNKLLNLSMYDEQTLDKINGTMEVGINIYSLGTETLIASYNNTFTYDTGAETSICLNNITTSYKLTYDIRYWGNTSYYKKYKIVQNMVITNTTETQDVRLYNLLQSLGYIFKVIVVGNTYTIGNSGLLIDAQKQYIALNEFISVENSVTDASGDGILHLITASDVYNFIISYEGTVLGTFTNYQVQCQNPSTLQCTITLNLAQSTGTIEDYINYREVSISYELDEDSKILYLTYVSTDGEVHTIDQTVIENDGFGNTTICTGSSTGTSGTITCSIPIAYQNKSYFSTVYVDGEYKETKFFSLGLNFTDTDTYGIEIFIEILLYTCLVFLFISHPVLIIIGSVVSIFLSVVLIYITGASFGAMLGVFMFYLIGGIIAIWQISKRL